MAQAGSAPPDPTAVGSDGSSEQPYGLPYFLHDFDAFLIHLTILGGLGGYRVPGVGLGLWINNNGPLYAARSPVDGSSRPCRSGNATFTPLDESGINNYHYIAEKCYYPEEGDYSTFGFYDGVYKHTSSGDRDNGEAFYELDRFFGLHEADGPSDRRIPPEDFRPLLSGTRHVIHASDETTGIYTTTDAIDELTVHNHGSLRNFSTVFKSNSGEWVSYAVNYDVTQAVRDPVVVVVVEDYVHQLGMLHEFMMNAGESRPGNPRDGVLKNGTYELQVRTLEPFNYSRDRSIVSGAYTLNLVSHNISAEVRHFEGGYDVTYTNNGETQTKRVQ